MNKILIILFGGLLATLPTFSQTINGKVINAKDQSPIFGANISFISNPQKATTNQNGLFYIVNPVAQDTLIISYVGYKSKRVPVAVGVNQFYTVLMEENTSQLKEVMVNTGYYQTSKERATGSFTQISNELINRSVSTNILDRLEDITSGLQFDRRGIRSENVSGASPQLRVRGLSTIAAGSSPLIVVDNFPYDGDITSINPNDIESITILKDAAAASIWGARAGNGVIVINTKQGKYNQQTRVNFNSVVNLTDKPDLYYTRNYLPSATVMDIQRQLFDKGSYSEDNQTYIPAYVELLIKKREGQIDDVNFAAQQLQMQQTDLRQQALRYLYQQGIQQQYALNVNGGDNAYKYYLAAGYDQNRANVIGNDNNRINLNFQNTFKISSKLELDGSIFYTQQHSRNNGITYSSIGNGVQEPYTLLADGSGNALSTGYLGKRSLYLQQAENNGLLDWQYRPLDEARLINTTSESSELRANTGLKYTLFNNFNISVNYQYLRGTSQRKSSYDAASFYARDLINSFTQEDGLQIIPNGGILDGSSPLLYQSHTGRLQLNYNRNFTGGHEITALAGGEIAQQVAEQNPGFRLYNYSDDDLGGTNQFDYTQWYTVRPLGSAQIQRPSGSALRNNNRNLSYFSNAAYTYLKRYTISGSARWDGSNLLGVKTNQRGTILWSAGGSWEISKEPFYRQHNWLPYLRIRATYGSGGIIDKSQSQYPTVAFYTDSRTNLPYADLLHPGNPRLRWEQVNTLNLGIDWSLRNQRISGSFEWYDKDAKYLLGSKLIDPTTGAGANYRENYANLLTKGFDLQLNTININGAFKWQSTFLLSYTQNKITNYTTPTVSFISAYFNNSTKPPIVGSSVDALYVLPWNGLNPQTGLPIIYINDQISTRWSNYVNTFKPENLQVAGVEIPPHFGSFRNTFSWKGIQLSALLSFKWGYVFRRTSMEAGGEYLISSPRYNVDYFNRWKQPGDEAFTDVPASTPTYNSSLGTVYTQSAALVTSGDHIRLQDINLNYTLPTNIISRLPFHSVKLYLYGRNLGVIWRKNKFGIDPDYANALYPAPKTFAFGLQIGL